MFDTENYPYELSQKGSIIRVFLLKHKKNNLSDKGRKKEEKND